MQVNQLNWRCMLHAMLLLATVAILAACQRESPEQALREQVHQMQAAAEARDPSAFIDAVAEDFSGNSGMDRAALHNMLRMQALAKSSIGVTTGPLQIQMQGDQASVRFDAILAGGSGRFLPDSAQGYSISSGWRIEKGEWRAYYAQWEPMLGGESR